MLQRSIVIKNQVSAVSVRLASTKGSRWKFWAKEGKEEEESLELPSEADMFSMQQEEYRREAEMEAVQQKRNKSRTAHTITMKKRRIVLLFTSCGFLIDYLNLCFFI